MPNQVTATCPICHHSTNFLVDAAKPGIWDAWGKVVTILLAAGSLVIAGIAGLAPTETTDIGKARAFLGSYYGNAPYQPDSTWKKLSTSYKQNGAEKEDKLTHASYVKYFRQFEDMQTSDITNYDGRRGEWYAATVYRLNKNGSSATTRYAYQLQCPWQSKLPTIKCSSANIQILNVCVVQPSGKCREDQGLMVAPLD